MFFKQTIDIIYIYIYIIFLGRWVYEIEKLKGEIFYADLLYKKSQLYGGSYWEASGGGRC